jgi:colanic acid/amylovoran biosynthesis glycosyltransferase
MKNITILHSFPIWLSQTQTWIHSQVLELQRLGVNAHVACEHTENLDQFSVKNIHCLADDSFWRKAWDRALRKLRLRRHLDHLVRVGRNTGTNVVHSHFGNFGWANMGALRRLGAKHVVTFYGLDVNMLPTRFPIWKKRYKDLFANVDLILCEGSHMAQCIVDLGCPEHKIKIHHLGVGVDEIRFKPRQWSSGESLKVLIAASFREKKGIPVAINALGQLQRDMRIELTIIGNAGADRESKREKAKILHALERSGLKSHTRLLGYQRHSEMLKEAAAHHIFLQPSITASDGDTEGGAPVSIIEMLATGMPVVSTHHCDIPEVMGPALQHLLVPEGDATALAGVMGMLIAQPEQWEMLALSGRRHIETEYHKAVQAVRLIENYESLLTA